MLWSVASIAGATGGRVLGAGHGAAEVEETITAVTIDSRTAAAGALFVALRAERDGHDFVSAAVAAGAGAVLVSDAARVPPGVAAIVVEDTSAALLDLGRAARRRISGPVVGITGSVGKTSTKDLVAAGLSGQVRVVASEKSFNNELGLPLTLANAAPGVEVAVLEMGARGKGHIELLCSVGRPTVGVVTSVAAAHTEAFGDLDGVAEAKGELVEALPAGGWAVLNGDDWRVRSMAGRTNAGVLTYSGQGRHADLVAADVRIDPELRPRFTADTPWGKVEVRLEARGAHQVDNALAALAVTGACGLDLGEAAEALARSGISPWRMEVNRTPAGAVIINDAYNANPASMAAALRALAALEADRRFAVVGVMAELGSLSDGEHQAVADLAARLGIVLLPVETTSYGVAPLGSIDEAAERLAGVGAGDAVLVKASRVAGLERLASRLLGL